jgi:hypothetical protein
MAKKKEREAVSGDVSGAVKETPVVKTTQKLIVKPTQKLESVTENSCSKPPSPLQAS